MFLIPPPLFPLHIYIFCRHHTHTLNMPVLTTRLSVARWRHLAPPPDTGHSVWACRRGVEEGWGGGYVTLRWPSTTTTRETPCLVGIETLFLSLTSRVLSLPPLTPVCRLDNAALSQVENTIRRASKWLSPPPFLLPLGLCFSLCSSPPGHITQKKSTTQ